MDHYSNHYDNPASPGDGCQDGKVSVHGFPFGLATEEFVKQEFDNSNGNCECCYRYTDQYDNECAIQKKFKHDDPFDEYL